MNPPYRVSVGVPGVGQEGLDMAIGMDVVTGIEQFEKAFGAATSLERDLLAFAGGVFATDLRCDRGEREEFLRTIELSVAVTNVAAFNHAKDDLEELLYRLTFDAWFLTFVPLEGAPEENRAWAETEGTTLLLSGGLDSCSSACELLEDPLQRPVAFVSHRSGNTQTASAQKRLVEYLERTFGKRFAYHWFRVEVTKGKKSESAEAEANENTQRTRSFMFMTLGMVVARRLGHRRVFYVAENGQFAVHLPLTTARAAAFSTRTAHPEVLAQAQTAFAKLLGKEVGIENPFLYLTKTEVAAKLFPQHAEAVGLTSSCWKNARVGGHCGGCVPCIVRRVALYANGHFDEDRFKGDVLGANLATTAADDIDKRNLVDVLEFYRRVETTTPANAKATFTDLYSEHFDGDLAFAMYRRFAEDLRNVSNRYPNLKGRF